MKPQTTILALILTIGVIGTLITTPVVSQTVPQAINSSPFVVKPYLQIGRNPSPTSLNLLWHTTDDQVKWDVELRMSASQNWIRFDSPQYSRVAVVGVA